MSQSLLADVKPGDYLLQACPTCGGTLTSQGICWACCDRLCSSCGRLTGSAFLALCFPCEWKIEHAKEPGSGTMAQLT